MLVKIIYLQCDSVAILLSQCVGGSKEKHDYVIYVTWAGGICLICTHEPEGAQRLSASAGISGKSQLYMLHMLCNTSGILKICQSLLNAVLLYYNNRCCL